VFFVIVLVMESYSCGCFRDNKRNTNDLYEDEDVAQERKRIMGGHLHDNDLLVLQNLTKVYKQGLKKVLAVDGISVGVPKGECFGLLGVNGAGKTTTFNMITSEIAPSRGSAQLNGNIISKGAEGMKQNVGYCPQFDALDNYMTAQELLYCHGRLKGIPSEELESIVNTALQKMGILNYGNKLIKTFSGGTKRKLSVAVALLGEPELLLMDEPTSGMDPASKRHLWDVVLDLMKDKRSVVMTSHSMEECDSLCTRLAIMVNGKFRCLGSPQHIKSKFADGYTMKLRLSKECDLDNVVETLKQSFPNIDFKDGHLNQVTLQIPKSDACLADIFEFIEKLRIELGILDYSVSQTTLDQVFVNFANQQTDGVVDLENGDADSTSLYSFSSQLSGSSSTIGCRPINAEGIRKSLKSLDFTLDPQKLTNDISNQV